MPYFHQQTKHSFKSIRQNAFFLDWQSQPRNYKTYPKFYPRFKIESIEGLKDLNLIGKISFKQEYRDGSYLLRTVPSAGALYPCEVYIQIRGIKGLPNGIYHYEPLSENLTLIYEIERDGVEHYFKDKSKRDGFIFLISTIYFRSSWKYQNRAIRYVFLDSGHQLGAIYASSYLMNRDSSINFDFDKLTLNENFGFENFEFFTVAFSSKDKIDKQIEPLKLKFPFVCGSDYLERNQFIEDSYKEGIEFESKELRDINFFENIDKDELKSAILNRRSIRAFRKEAITKDEFEFIIRDIFEFANLHNIEIFYTVHNIDDLEVGLYRDGELIKSGDFREKSKYLALEQKLGSDSAFTIYFSSSETLKYQKVSILSGFLAHIIYLKATMLNVGVSGIGAYYDDETKSFLNTQNNILYMLAIGK